MYNITLEQSDNDPKMYFLRVAELNGEHVMTTHDTEANCRAEANYWLNK